MSHKKKLFGTDGIRGKVGSYPVTAEAVLKLGFALGTVLPKKEHKRVKVVIGKDTRISGYMLESALEAGLAASGVDIALLGPMPTPAIAYLTRVLRADAGVVISASHNTYEDNGIKFFNSKGEKFPDLLEHAIEEQMQANIAHVASKYIGKASRLTDAQGRYIEFCKSKVPDLNLYGLTIVVDCANGASYIVGPQVFQELGAKVIAINTTPDGININDNCGSTNLSPLQQAVKEHKADLGIAFDGDGDRVIMVNPQGEVVNGDELLYILAAWYHKLNKNTGIVGTIMSNLGLELSLAELGIAFKRSKVGDRFVLEALKANNWILGGETSGHIICLDATTTGDGIIAALQVLAALQYFATDITTISKKMLKLPQILLNLPLEKKIDLEHPSLQEHIRKREDSLHGKGRVVLRASGTEPLLRIMVEGESEDLIKNVAYDLAETVQSFVTI